MTKVYILIVEHTADDNEDVYACATLERARARLDEYVQKEWSTTPGDPESMTRDQRIATYFDCWEESKEYEISEYEVLE